ncbi:MAG: tetratricopeptide repeat protein [Acidobacteriota bacterium]
MSRIQLMIGRNSLTLARPEEAIEALEHAENLLSETAIRDRLSILSAVLSVSGDALRSLARFNEAEAKHREALAIAMDLPESEDLLLSLNHGLGKTFSQQGRWSDAEMQYRKSVDLARRTLGPVHVRTATTIDSLAASIASQGRLDEAAPLFLEALEVRRSLLREDHPSLAFSLHNLGVLALDRGRPEESVGFHREALAIRLAAYGEKNPRTAWSHDGLGAALTALGRHDEASQHLETALEVRRATLGAEHPQIRRSLRLLAALHRDAGDLLAAAGRYREALAAGLPWEPESSKPDPNGAELALDLAEVLAELGSTDEVPEALAQAEARMEPEQEGELGPRIQQLRNSLPSSSPRTE